MDPIRTAGRDIGESALISGDGDAEAGRAAVTEDVGESALISGDSDAGAGRAAVTEDVGEADPRDAE